VDFSATTIKNKEMIITAFINDLAFSEMLDGILRIPFSIL
jgi:hypothetical protein